MYHYTACGLDNVILHGVEPIQDDHGEAVISIPALGLLHTTIAAGILAHDNGMSGKELRFLRTEFGLTQSQLAEIVRHSHQSIGRWERGDTPIDETAEVLIRVWAVEQLLRRIRNYLKEHAIDCSDLTDAIEASVELVARRVTRTLERQEIVIRRTEDGYRLEAA